jgi:hypothetical protein
MVSEEEVCQGWIGYKRTCRKPVTCYAVMKNGDTEHHYCAKHAPTDWDVITKCYDKVEWWTRE